MVCPCRCFFIAVTWTAIGNELMRLWLWLRILRLSRGNSNKCHSLADSPDSPELPPISTFPHFPTRISSQRITSSPNVICVWFTFTRRLGVISV